VLAGTGAHGAYHAGVLRAFQEAGVKIDVVAGHGIGAAAAALTAIDGAATLWEAKGPWQSEKAADLYAWTRGWRFARWLAAVFGIGSLIPARDRRQPRARWREAILGTPLETAGVQAVFADAIWQLVRGAATMRPTQKEIGRRYGEVLAESLGQPGVRELVMVATDVDARHDVTAALLREPYRKGFLTPRPGRERQAEAIDLAGPGREHALDFVCGALTPCVGAAPYHLTFAPDSYWRGETHRICDRPGLVVRLLEELEAAGAEQIVIVNAIHPRMTPHMLTSPSSGARHRLGDAIAAMEAATLQDALSAEWQGFQAVFTITPAHNPIGPFDMSGAYDQASDRHQALAELIERGYEDAHRQFIEPVVGASGEHLQIADV
jgi:hypothetical protein